MLLAKHASEPVGVPLPLGDRAVALYNAMLELDHADAATARSKGSAIPGPEQRRGDRDFSVVYDYLRELSTKSKGD